MKFKFEDKSLWDRDERNIVLVQLCDYDDKMYRD